MGGGGEGGRGAQSDLPHTPGNFKVIEATAMRLGGYIVHPKLFPLGSAKRTSDIMSHDNFDNCCIYHCFFSISFCSGSSYYWNTITNQVSWHHPLGKLQQIPFGLFVLHRV